MTAHAIAHVLLLRCLYSPLRQHGAPINMPEMTCSKHKHCWPTTQNDMNINSDKSKEIIISFAQDGNFRSTIPNIKIDGRDVAQVCYAKLLGVTISQDLT